MATGGGSPVAAASNGKSSQLLLLSILTLSLYTRVGDCNASGSGSSLMNPVSGLTLSVDEGSNTVIVSWTDNSLITMSYFVNYTATVGSTEIDSASDAVTTSDTDASWTATHNITGAFVQSGVNITVSVEAVVDDQLCDPAFASLLVPGEFSPSPEEFTVSGPTSTSLTLSWTVPFSQVTPNSFSISYTVDKLTGTPPAIPSGSLSIAINDTDLDTADNANFSYVLGGLTAYTEYTFNLSSLYGANTSSVVSATGTTSEALSGPVEGLSAGITNDSSSDSFSVSISWSEPSEPNGVILQYNYTVSSTDTNTAIVSGSTGNTSVVESMLTVIEPFTNYTVGVVAFNYAGEGQESSVTVESPQTAPGPVGDLQASFDETGSMFDSMTREYTLNLDIVWSEPPMQNGVITSYSVTVYQTNDLSDIVYSNDTLIAPNVTASVMVLAFTNYTVSVAASTSAGQGNESTVTVESPEAEPGPVGDLGASFVETTAMFDSMDNMWTIDIDITWEEPVNPNGVITAYNVTVYQTDDLSDIVYSNNTLTTPNVTASVEAPAYTDYTVSVAASTSAGQGDESTVSITSPEAEPGRVGNLVASFDTMPDFDAGTRNLTVDITITWTQPMYPNGVIQNYNVTVFETANPSNMVYNDSTLIDPNVTTSVIVLPFTDYTVSVAASTSAGQGEEETVTLTSPEAVPGQVESLNGSFISSGAVFDSDSRMYDLTLEVEWDEPTYPNGIIVSYNVTVFRTANSSDAVFSDESLMVTSATPSVMVLPFTNYTVSVAASTSAGQGDENSVTIESPEAVPGPVVGLDSTFSTTERSYEPTTRTYTVDLSITWGEPQYPNGVITLYQVIVTQFDDTTVEVYRNSGIEAPNVTASVMVLAFTDYTVSVAASTSAGQGDNVTDTVTAPEAAPEMVENLDAAFVSDGSVFNSMNNMWTIDIDITWEEPVNPNGVITAYNVTVYKTDDLSDIVYSNDAVTDTSVTASVEVPAYTDYTVSVAASTSAGQGEEATVNITSPEAAPSQVESLTAEFGESISFNPGSRMHNVTLNISWSQPLYPNGDILSYEVIVTQTSDPSVVIYGENVTDTEVMPSVMVLPFTDYTVSVAASTSAGQGDEDTVTVESPEAAPSQVRELSAEFVFVESDFNSTARMWDLDISITWTQPMYPNGQIDSYNVTVYETAAASNVVYSNDAVTDTSVTAPVEVPAYTDYTVSVAASTSAGQGDESTVTIISPEAAPGRVGNLAASFSSPMYDPTTQILTADITITWTQPMYPNGVIQTYNVTVFETANPSNMVYSDDTLIDPNVTTSVVALPFTNYTVSVAASTSAGQGEEDTVTVESPEAAPSAPREVMAEALTSTSIRVYWTIPEPTNGVITGYRVTYFVTESSDSPVDRDVPRDQLSLDIPSLTPFTNYTVYVEAETVAAVGEKSDDATVVTLEDAPTVPRNVVTSAINATSITIEWEEPATANGIVRGYNVSHNVSESVMSVAGSVRAATFSDLSPFTWYFFTVIAFTIEAGPEANVSARTDEAAPTAPLNLVVTDTTPFTVSLDWEEPATPNGIIDNYIIRYYETSSPGSITLYNDSIQETSAVVYNLMAFTSYTFRVSGMTVDEGPFAEISATTNESTPSAPLEVMAANTSSTSIIVSWSPPAIPRGIIISYTITYYLTSTGESTPQTVETTTDATSSEVTGLVKFREYSVYVQASTVAGIGDRSDTVNVFTDEDRPSAPQNLVVEETGPTTIMANWSGPASPNGILLHFNIYLEREGDQRFDVIETRLVPAVDGIDDYTMSFDNLTAFTLYRVEVSAETRIGEGPRVSDLVNTDPDGASPPTNVVVETINSTAIRVSWGYPEIPRGNITGYTVFTDAVVNGQMNVTLERVNDMSGQMQVFGGLDQFTNYTFQVAAFAVTPEQIHFGQPSEPIMRQTDEDVPTQPMGFNLNNVTDEPGQLMAEWSQPVPPNGVITAYTVTCTLSTDQQYQEQTTTEPYEVVVTTRGGETQTTVMGLQPFTNYDCSVSANTSIGEGPPSNVLTARTVEAAPSAPRELTIVSSGATSLNVSWMIPTPANGIITTYTIYCSGSEDQYCTDQVIPASSTHPFDGLTSSTTLMDLTAFTNYTCSISASTSAGEGPRSDEVTVATDQSIPSDAPRSFAAMAINSTSIQLSWQRPATPNGVIVNYSLEYYIASDGAPPSSPVTVPPTMTSYDVSGLNEFTEYTFRLAAVTTGQGPLASATEMTLEDVPSAGVVDLTGVNTSSTSLLISWGPPPGPYQNGIIRAYNISYGLTSQNDSMYSDRVTNETMIELESLEKFRQYTVVVRPFTIGAGPETSVQVKTDSDLPSEPVNLSYENVTASSITLFWEPPLEPNGVILQYRVTYVEAVTNRTVTIQNLDPAILGNTSLLIEDLMEYHYYEMRVAASTDKGFGNYSAPLTVLTDEHAPDAPENFTVTVVDSQSVRATWEDPLDPNGIILSFSLSLQLTPGQDYLLPLPPVTNFTLSPDTFERDIAGLHPFARYEFSLRAATSFGGGSVTNSFAMTNEAAPSEGVRNVSAPAISPRQFDLVWTPPQLENWNGILTNYSISVVAVTNCTEPVEMVGVPESPRTETLTEFTTDPNPTTAYGGGNGEVREENFTLESLEEFQGYQVSVSVWNREGSGPENDVMEICVTTLEDAPSQPPTLESFVVTSNTTAELTWQPPPPLHQNGIIVDYNLRICDNRSNDCKNVNTGSSDTYYQFSGLDPFTEYTVSVAAVTRPGEGPLSLNITNTTFEGLPTMPRNLTEEDFDHSYVVLTWTPPAIPYGNIFSYRIRYQSYKQEISQETCSVGLSEEFSEKPSFNLTQLIGDSFYCIQVSGRTGAGFGNISTIVVELPVGPPPVDVIDPVEEPEVVPQPVVDPITGDDGISDTSAKVSFSLPSEINSNGPVDRALIYVQRMPSSSQAIGTWYESSRLTQEWPQYAALSVNITPNSQGRKRQEGDIEVSFTIGNSSMTCGPTDTVCNGPLNPSADYGIRYTLFSGIQSQEFPFFPGAQFTTERIPSDEQSSNIGAIVGAVVGVLLAVLVIITVAAVVGYFVFNARRKGIIELTGYVITSSKPSERPLLSHKNGSTHANNTNKPPMFLSPSDPGIVPLGQVNKNAAGATGKSRSPSRKANSRRMMLKDLSEAVRDMLNDSGYIFSEEYEKVTEVGLDHSKEASLMAENRAKNRYTNILAYDHSRVKLSYVDDDPGSDYINASYIPGYRMRRAYVATQGPLPATFDDFWRMVWEQNTHTIVMLTQLVERGRTKCHRYWPGAECIVYGEIAVEMLSEKEKEDWTVREFKLSMEKTSRTVWHYQFTSWPDHGVPDTPTPALDFVRTVRESVLMDHGPLVVHCSAGVGRTGCYVALDTLLQHVEEHDFIDVFGLVSEMRQHRNHMIQTEAQYVFVHKAMVEFIDTHYTGKSPTRFGTYPSLYTNHFAEDSTQMTDYYGDFLSEETHM